MSLVSRHLLSIQFGYFLKRVPVTLSLHVCMSAEQVLEMYPLPISLNDIHAQLHYSKPA